jgi:hypothetical protein
MRLRVASVFGVPVACIALGCAADTGPPYATLTAAITGGSVDGGDLGVVGLVQGRLTVECGGTLVAPRVVVTAAHCVPVATQVFFGSAPLRGGAWMNILEARAHPDYNPMTFANDIAVVLLPWPAKEGATPWPMRTAPLDPGLVGTSVRIIGYGAVDGAPVERRVGSATIGSVELDAFKLLPGPAQTCFGDSGGPALLETNGVAYLTGVTSNGNLGCTTSSDTRVDRYVADFLQPFVTAVTGDANVGSRCAPAGDCAVGSCIAANDDPAFTYCSTSCSPSSPCPRGMQCLASMCRYPLPSPVPLGAACSADSDCAEGLCAASADDGATTRCVTPCVPGRDALPDTCPRGVACGASADPTIPGVCLVRAAGSPAPWASSDGASRGCSAAGAGRGMGNGVAVWLLLALVSASRGRKRS